MRHEGDTGSTLISTWENDDLETDDSPTVGRDISPSFSKRLQACSHEDCIGKVKGHSVGEHLLNKQRMRGGQMPTLPLFDYAARKRPTSVNQRHASLTGYIQRHRETPIAPPCLSCRRQLLGSVLSSEAKHRIQSRWQQL